MRRGTARCGGFWDPSWLAESIPRRRSRGGRPPRGIALYQYSRTCKSQRPDDHGKHRQARCRCARLLHLSRLLATVAILQRPTGRCDFFSFPEESHCLNFFLGAKSRIKTITLVRATSSLFTTGLPGAARRASHVTPPRRTSAWCGENIGQRIGLVDRGAGTCACLRGSQAGSWGTRVRGATRWRSAGCAPQRWARTTALGAHHSAKPVLWACGCHERSRSSRFRDRCGSTCTA